MLFDGARLGKVARALRKGGWLKFTPALMRTAGGGNGSETMSARMIPW